MTRARDVTPAGLPGSFLAGSSSPIPLSSPVSVAS